MVFGRIPSRRRASADSTESRRRDRPSALHGAQPAFALPRIDPLRLATSPADAVRGARLEPVAVPDLLEAVPRAVAIDEELASMMELAFLGLDTTDDLDDAVSRTPVAPSAWNPEHFARDLFLEELVEECLSQVSGDHHARAYLPFLVTVLANPPVELATVHFRQGILRELATDATLRARTEELHSSLRTFLALLRRCSLDVRVEAAIARLEVLRQARHTISLMAGGFGDATSGLVRLHEGAAEICASSTFAVLEALLRHEDEAAILDLGIALGADGRVSRLEVRGVRESKGNPFYRPGWRRRFDAVRLFWRGYRLDSRTVADRLILAVYAAIVPELEGLVRVMCQLEVYLSALAFADRLRRDGYQATIPQVEPGAKLTLEKLVNPLLLRGGGRPVPSTVQLAWADSIVLVTGPNSGGKTRLLQAIGLAQVLGQSGLFVPAAHARLPLAGGLFAANVETGGADQAEGRLGTELLRVRALFEAAPPGSVVLLDELCSGTNPSEAIEIVTMVLRLLRELGPVALITTHFLDFAHQLQDHPPVERLEFLRVEVDADANSTYQFVPGVAFTSMASATARRLGVTFDELARLVRGRDGS